MDQEPDACGGNHESTCPTSSSALFRAILVRNMADKPLIAQLTCFQKVRPFRSPLLSFVQNLFKQLNKFQSFLLCKSDPQCVTLCPVPIGVEPRSTRRRAHGRLCAKQGRRQGNTITRLPERTRRNDATLRDQVQFKWGHRRNIGTCPRCSAGKLAPIEERLPPACPKLGVHNKVQNRPNSECSIDHRSL